MKIYYKRNGVEVTGATNIKHFNELNNFNNIEYLELDNVLRMLNLQNVITVLRAVYARMAAGGELYISDYDSQTIANQVKFQQITIEEFNQKLFEQGNVSCLALFWLKVYLEQMGFQVKECGYGYNKDFWIRVIK